MAPVAFVTEQKSHAAVTICFMDKKAAFQFFWSTPKLSSSEMHYCSVLFQFGKHLDLYIHGKGTLLCLGQFVPHCIQSSSFQLMNRVPLPGVIERNCPLLDWQKYVIWSWNVHTLPIFCICLILPALRLYVVFYTTMHLSGKGQNVILHTLLSIYYWWNLSDECGFWLSKDY